MTHRKALERGETKVENREVPSKAVWPIAKSLMKWGGTKTPTAAHGHVGIKCHPTENAKAIAHCLENTFTLHNLCDENNKDRVQALLESVDDTPLEN
jgi:hypothetical protein